MLNEWRPRSFWPRRVEEVGLSLWAVRRQTAALADWQIASIWLFWVLPGPVWSCLVLPGPGGIFY